MSTLVLSISNNVIKSFEKSVTVTQIRDPSTNLHFRFSTVDRTKGSFFVRRYKKGKDIMVHIGKYPEISAQRASQAIPNIHLKEDYFNHNELTLMGELCDWYVQRTKSNKQIKGKTAKQTVSLINNHIKPYLAQLNIMTINESLLDKHWYTPIQSKLALSTILLALVTLNAMFTRATKLKVISRNPVEKLSIANFTHQRPMVKVGRLTNKKLKACLTNLPSLPIEKQMLLVLLLLHGTRIGETTKARWEDFDFENMLWRIPASDTKTKQPHTLPLTPLAILWLKAYRRYQYMNKRSKCLFPQQVNRRKVQSPNTSSRIVSSIANGAWTAHDIRKYARSAWLEHGVDYIIGEILLNHSLSKLDQSYIQTTAMNLCRDALTQWSEHLKDFGLAEPTFLTNKNQKK
jgi:integrase